MLIEFPNIFHWKPAKKMKLSVWSWCKIWAKLMSNIVKKSKETGNIIRFLSYFTWDYLLKQEAVVVKSPEWKFIAIIARNTEF